MLYLGWYPLQDLGFSFGVVWWEAVSPCEERLDFKGLDKSAFHWDKCWSSSQMCIWVRWFYVPVHPARLSDIPFLWCVEAATNYLPALVWPICDFLRSDSTSWFLFVHLSKTRLRSSLAGSSQCCYKVERQAEHSSLKTKLQKIKSFQPSHPFLHFFPVHLLAVRKQKFCTCVPSPIGCRSLGIRPSFSPFISSLGFLMQSPASSKKTQSTPSWAVVTGCRWCLAGWICLGWRVENLMQFLNFCIPSRGNRHVTHFF